MSLFVEPKPRNARTRVAWDNAQKIIDRYMAGEDCPSIGRSYQIASTCLFRILRKNGVRLRPHSEWSRHKLNRDYFANIDSEEKAQILGFIYADGCISENKNSYKLLIQLHEKDHDYLDNIRKAIGYSGPMRRVKSKKTYHYNLAVNSKKLSTDLMKLGATPRKTFTLDFPTLEQVPSQFIISFVRGFMEGDGSIHTKTCPSPDGKGYKYLRVSFRGTEMFLSKLRLFLAMHNIESRLYMDCGRIGQLCIQKAKSVSLFLKLIYAIKAPFVMQRKYDRALPNLNQP